MTLLTNDCGPRSSARWRWSRRTASGWCAVGWTATSSASRAATNGFGYDPIFVPDGHDVTSAQLASEEKDAISHRGKALRELVPHLRALLIG